MWRADENTVGGNCAEDRRKRRALTPFKELGMLSFLKIESILPRTYPVSLESARSGEGLTRLSVRHHGRCSRGLDPRIQITAPCCPRRGKAACVHQQ